MAARRTGDEMVPETTPRRAPDTHRRRVGRAPPAGDGDPDLARSRGRRRRVRASRPSATRPPRDLPDVALVIVGEHSEQAFELIRTIVHEAACPGDRDPRTSRIASFIDQAARLGIFSYIAHAAISRTCRARWTSSLQRFAEYHALEGAFGATGRHRAGKGDPDGAPRGRRAARPSAVLREHARRTESEDGRRRGIGPGEPPSSSPAG